MGCYEENCLRCVSVSGLNKEIKTEVNLEIKNLGTHIGRHHRSKSHQQNASDGGKSQALKTR